MKSIRKAIIIGLMMLVIAAISATAFAASAYKTPAEEVAGITGRELRSMMDERTETQKTYGTIAKEAGKLEEFKQEMLEIKKDQLAERVAAGQMNQQQADEIVQSIEARQATCDGSGSGSGAGGYGFGMGNRGNNRNDAGGQQGRGKQSGGRGQGWQR